MSNPTRRRPSPAVFRRRRLVLVLVVLAVIAAVVLAIWQPWRAAGTSSPGQTPKPQTSAATPAPSASTASEAPVATEPEAAPAPGPEASATEPAIAACTTADISVQAVTDKESYAAGELPLFSITLSNTSATPCLINVGTATQSFVVTSGTDTWWRSTDCQSESSDQPVQLAAGQTVSSVTPLPWDRTRSSVDTCTAARPKAPAGYFHLQVSIGGIQAADTKMFQLR